MRSINVLAVTFYLSLLGVVASLGINTEKFNKAEVCRKLLFDTDKNELVRQDYYDSLLALQQESIDCSEYGIKEIATSFRTTHNSLRMDYPEFTEQGILLGNIDGSDYETALANNPEIEASILEGSFTQFNSVNYETELSASDVLNIDLLDPETSYTCTLSQQTYAWDVVIQASEITIQSTQESEPVIELIGMDQQGYPSYYIQENDAYKAIQEEEFDNYWSLCR